MRQTQLYSNVLVKVGVERSHLLSNDKLKALTDCKSLDEFASQLQETVYGAQLTKSSRARTSREFERVFRENLIESYCILVKNSPVNVSQFLKMHLIKIEHENIKTILKAVSVGLPHEKILSSIYLSVEDFLKRQDVIKQASLGFQVKSVVDALSNTVYGPTLIIGLQKYEETGSTKFFDFLLDKLLYEQLGDAFQKLPKKEQKHAFFYTSMEIDSFIVLTILRAKILKYDSHSIRMVLPNTRARNISENIIEALLHSDNFDLAFNRIQQSRYAPFFVKIENPEELVSSAERAFRKAMLEHFVKTKVGDQFNVNIPLGFMMRKAVETQNLIAISVGIEHGWKQDQIVHSLLFLSR